MIHVKVTFFTGGITLSGGGEFQGLPPCMKPSYILCVYYLHSNCKYHYHVSYFHLSVKMPLTASTTDIASVVEAVTIVRVVSVVEAVSIVEVVSVVEAVSVLRRQCL